MEFLLFLFYLLTTMFGQPCQEDEVLVPMTEVGGGAMTTAYPEGRLTCIPLDNLD